MSNTTLPERSILLDGTSNFRGIGGYLGHGGGRVKWRKKLSVLASWAC